MRGDSSSRGREGRPLSASGAAVRAVLLHARRGISPPITVSAAAWRRGLAAGRWSWRGGGWWQRGGCWHLKIFPGWRCWCLCGAGEGCCLPGEAQSSGVPTCQVHRSHPAVDSCGDVGSHGPAGMFCCMTRDVMSPQACSELWSLSQLCSALRARIRHRSVWLNKPNPPLRLYCSWAMGAGGGSREGTVFPLRLLQGPLASTQGAKLWV